MKTALPTFILILITMNLFGQYGQVTIPKEWNKTFVISLSHTGSMSGGSSHLTYTYDSCKYIITPGHGKVEKISFALSQSDRDKILAKMRELKVEKVNPELHLGTQNDGWSTMLCLGGHCLEGGSAAEMSDKDQGIFVDACSFLEDFARGIK